jgi:hypothetical protein
MNYQGVMWQEIFLECHCTKAAPQRSLLIRERTVAGLENYILNSACTDSIPASSPLRVY